MSVLVVTNLPEHHDFLTNWGKIFAEGLGTDLVLCTPEPGSSSIRGQVNEVLAQINEVDAKLLIVAKEPDNLQSIASKIARQLFEGAPCMTVLLRPAVDTPTTVEKILVPAAGGPDAEAALQIASKIVVGTKGELVPLYVQADADEASLEIGQKHLDKIVRKASVHKEAEVEGKVILADDVFQGISWAAHAEQYDLILVGSSHRGTLRRILFGTLPEKLLSEQKGNTIGVVRASETLFEKVLKRIEAVFDLTVPQLSREDRITLVEQLETGSRWNFDFLALLSLSTLIASMGLIQNSVAVVIGAMLVAPLMTPLLGAGLALVQGNLPLMQNASRAIFYGFFCAIGIGFLVGLVLPIPQLTSEMLARGNPTVIDMAVAFFSGLAAAYCTARPGLSGALPGVAIAAALVPPVSVAGITLAAGNPTVAQGAATLFITNVVIVILSASLSFYAGGVRGKIGESYSNRWAKRTIAILLLAAAVLAVPLISVWLGQLAG